MTFWLGFWIIYLIISAVSFYIMPRDYHRESWLDVLADFVMHGLFWPLVAIVIGGKFVFEYLSERKPPRWLE